MNGHNETLEELSHAWLHMEAVRAGLTYQRCDRPADARGIDALVYAGSRVLHVQLKATAGSPSPQPTGVPFRLRRADYDRLRSAAGPDVFLAAFFFPADPNVWVLESGEGVFLQGRAYWMSLRGAPTSDNDLYQTVYLPPTQPLTAVGLRMLATQPTEASHE